MDGNCFLTAVLKSCEMEDHVEGKKFGHHQLRLCLINHLIDYRNELFDEISEDIKMVYGALEDVESSTGSMSYKSYLLYMIRDGIWCDIIMIKALASMWACKVTIFTANSLYIDNFRHNFDPFVADICLLFNGNHTQGHYCSVVRTDGQNFIIAKPKYHESYDRATDRLERGFRKDYDWMDEGENAMMQIPVDVYKSMLHKCQMYDKMVQLTQEKEKESEGVPPLPSLDPTPGSSKGKDTGKKKKDTSTSSSTDDDEDENGGGGAGESGKKKKKKRKRDPADPTTRKRKGGKYQAEEKIPDEELGKDVTVCPKCGEDKKSHSNLVSHIRKFHEDVFNFLCKECDRGFLTRLGWNNHKKSHKMKEEEYLSCDKPGCKSKFTTKDSKKGHMRKYHGNFKKDCEFGCGKTFTTKTNYQQHVKSCSKNPNRKELFCEICGKGGYYLLSRMQEHKRDIHKWR